MKIKWLCPFTPDNQCWGEKCFAFQTGYSYSELLPSFYDDVKYEQGILGRTKWKKIHIVKTQFKRKVVCTFLGNEHSDDTLYVEDRDYWRTLLPSFNEKLGDFNFKPISEFIENHEGKKNG